MNKNWNINDEYKLESIGLSRNMYKSLPSMMPVQYDRQYGLHWQNQYYDLYLSIKGLRILDNIQLNLNETNI